MRGDRKGEGVLGPCDGQQRTGDRAHDTELRRNTHVSDAGSEYRPHNLGEREAAGHQLYGGGEKTVDREDASV